MVPNRLVLASAAVLLITAVAHSDAQLSDTTSLREIEFDQLSERDPNPLGEKALAIHPEQWKHSETDHFIYHFVHKYVAKNAHASYQRARGYISKAHSESIASQDLIPLRVLLATTHPPAENVATFYNESERLARFLAATDKKSFLALLDALARHQPFEIALNQTYAGKFTNITVLEEKFREYAAKDFGSSLQQVSSE